MKPYICIQARPEYAETHDKQWALLESVVEALKGQSNIIVELEPSRREDVTEYSDDTA